MEVVMVVKISLILSFLVSVIPKSEPKSIKTEMSHNAPSASQSEVSYLVFQNSFTSPTQQPEAFSGFPEEDKKVQLPKNLRIKRCVARLPDGSLSDQYPQYSAAQWSPPLGVFTNGCKYFTKSKPRESPSPSEVVSRPMSNPFLFAALAATTLAGAFASTSIMTQRNDPKKVAKMLSRTTDDFQSKIDSIENASKLFKSLNPPNTQNRAGIDSIPIKVALSTVTVKPSVVSSYASYLPVTGSVVRMKNWIRPVTVSPTKKVSPPPKA
ncbi:unnamed protein product [Orchesella dallaii]|uniref:Uncharacterized protein n=1 Tax=Orchesella dallaii TaxID=48710 RepID=A0ABP1PMX3_9HEXA